MKKYLFIFLLGVSALFSSCADNVEPIFFVTVDRDFDIPGNLNTIETHFFELKNVPVNLDQNLSVYNMTEDQVVNINPADATLTSSFNNVDWTFIQRIEVYAVSRLDNSKKQRMFNSTEPDFTNRSQLVMFNSFVDVKDTFKEGLIDLEVRIKTRAFVPGNIRANLTFSYAVFDQI